MSGGVRFPILGATTLCTLPSTSAQTYVRMNSCFFLILSAVAGGPAPQFAFFGTIVAALTALLVVSLPETNGITFS